MSMVALCQGFFKSSCFSPPATKRLIAARFHAEALEVTQNHVGLRAGQQLVDTQLAGHEIKRMAGACRISTGKPTRLR